MWFNCNKPEHCSFLCRLTLLHHTCAGDKTEGIHMRYKLLPNNTPETAAVLHQDNGFLRVLRLVGQALPTPGASVHPGKSTLIHQTITYTSRKCRLESYKKVQLFLFVEVYERKGLSQNVSAPNKASRNSSPLVSNCVTKAVIYSNSLYFLEKAPKWIISCSIRLSWTLFSGSSKSAERCRIVCICGFFVFFFKWGLKLQCVCPYIRHPNKLDWSSKGLKFKQTTSKCFKKSNNHSHA